MTQDLLLAIDQGTTSTRAIAFDRRLRPVASCGIPLASAHPAPGWVEQDPEAIVDSVVMSVARVLEEVGGPERIVATGLANQGETVVAWDAEDRSGARSSDRLAMPALDHRSSSAFVRQAWNPTSGNAPGCRSTPTTQRGSWPGFSSTTTRSARHRPTARLRFGTVDAWLTARLDSGDGRTDTSTASRTQLLNLGTSAGMKTSSAGSGRRGNASESRRDSGRTRAAGSPALAGWRSRSRRWHAISKRRSPAMAHSRRVRSRPRTERASSCSPTPGRTGMRRQISRRRSRGRWRATRRRARRPPRSCRAASFRRAR